MRRDIRAGSLPSGGHLMLLIASVMVVVLLCVANFSIRWTLWCNIAANPLREAGINVGLIAVSALFAAFALSDMFRPQTLWRVALVYGAFFLCIPTLMFFSDYLLANLLVVLSMYNVMRLQDALGAGKANVFFASFFLVIAVWFVPSAVVFLAAVYAGVLLFSPSDVRNWLIPLAGIATSYILLLTYEMVFLGGTSFFPEVSHRIFDMPYTDKIFKADKFYFYAVCLLAVLAYAYVKYWRLAAGEALPQKKRFTAISVMCVCAAVVIVAWPEYRYLTIFFALPFTAVVSRLLDMDGNRASRSAVRWYLAGLAALGLWFFK